MRIILQNKPRCSHKRSRLSGVKNPKIALIKLTERSSQNRKRRISQSIQHTVQLQSNQVRLGSV